MTSSAPNQLDVISFIFFDSPIMKSLSSYNGKYLMTFAPVSSCRISCELQIAATDEKWAVAMSLSSARGRVCRDSLSESSSSPSLYSQSRLYESSGMFQKSSSILMQLWLSVLLMSAIHSLSSALSKCAEMVDSSRKWMVSVGTCSTFLRQLLPFLLTTDSVMQFSYFIFTLSFIPPSKLYFDRRQRLKSLFASRISLANSSAFLMNSLTGRKGFLLLWPFLFSRSLPYFPSGLGQDWCFCSQTGSRGRLLELACTLKASGSFEDAFLAILGLAMCGSCSIQIQIKQCRGGCYSANKQELA